MSVFHSRTLNFPIIPLDFHPLPFLYSKGSDKYTLLCLHLQFGLSSTYGLLLMYPFFYVWPSYPSSGGLVLPFQAKSESSPPLSVTPRLGCVLLLCPEGFPVAQRPLPTQNLPTTHESRHLLFLPATSPKHVTNTYLP